MYFHSLGMVHGDLKGTSIVIDQNGHARLKDRGFLTLLSGTTDYLGSSVIGGTVRWMSPELLDPERFGFKKSRPTKQSDCYALGMVILEVLSEKPPFAGDYGFVIIRKVIDGKRPRRPEGAWFADDLWGILEQCWSPQPADRPHIKAVLECLGQVSEVLKSLPPVQGDVEPTDGDESDFTTSQNARKLMPRPSTSNKQVEIDTLDDPPHLKPVTWGPTAFRNARQQFQQKRRILRPEEENKGSTEDFGIRRTVADSLDRKGREERKVMEEGMR